MTLLQYWQQQLAVYQAEQAAAQSDLAAAQAQLAAANASVDTDQRALAGTTAAIAADRARLATTTVPADAQALVTAITTLIIQQRAQQGTLLDDQDAAAAAQAAADTAGATLARASARIASVQSTLTAVQADDARRTAYRNTVDAAPLKTMKTDAAAYRSSATVTNAATRIGKDFPAEILAIAKKRYDSRANRLPSLKTLVQHAQDALAAGNAADAGLAGAASEKGTLFTRAQEAVALYVATAASRYTKAQAVMSRLEAIELDATGTVPDVLTDAEKAQLTALSGAGAAAEPTAETLDGDLNGIFTAEDALAAEVLNAIASDVDTLGTNAQVAAKRTAVDTAKTAFTSAVAAFAGANKKDLDQWEAVIPDAAWAVLLDYEEATAALNDLAGTDPAALVSTMDTAEGDYTTALAAAAVSSRRADFRGDAIAYQQRLLDAAQAAVASRLPSAIRGDSY